MNFTEYRAMRNVIRRRKPKSGNRCHGIIVSIYIFILQFLFHILEEFSIHLFLQFQYLLFPKPYSS